MHPQSPNPQSPNPQVLKPQVLIAGAGPVGLTMAAELARYGVTVRIVDKAAARTDKSKALVVWSRTLELLDRAGCAGAFVAAGHKVTAATIMAGQKRIARVEIGGVDTPYPYALMLPQSETERLLEEHLGRLGVTVERRLEMTGFTQDEAGVTTKLRHADGREETVEAGWLVGCDGAHSTVRHTLGLAFEGETLPSDWVLADIHMTGLPFADSELPLYWHADGVLAMFPIAPGRYRVIADIGDGQGVHPADPTLADIQAIVDRRGPGGIALSDPIWLSAFRINERKVADYRSGRVFVAGDAAHVHSPAGGQGMNTGMQDAINLAWKLALAMRGARPDQLLASYSIERGAVGKLVLANAGRLTALAIMRNRAAQAVRNVVAHAVLGFGAVQHAMADTMTEVSIGYARCGSPLSGPGAHGLGGPAPGERVRPPAGQAPIGAGDTPRFALFAAPSEAADSLIEAHGALLEAAPRPPLHEGGMWLARPDGYVACAVKAGDAAAIGDYLASLGPSA